MRFHPGIFASAEDQFSFNGISADAAFPIATYGDYYTTADDDPATTIGCRIPAMITTANGTLLFAFEAKDNENLADTNSRAILIRRSTDNGVTWSVPYSVYDVSDASAYTATNATFANTADGDILLMFNVSDEDRSEAADVLVCKSTNDGVSFSTPVDITSQITNTGSGELTSPPFEDNAWGWYSVGPGHGITLTMGANAGRVIFPCYHRTSTDGSADTFVHFVYTDNGGTSYGLLGGVDDSKAANANMTENIIIEIAEDLLYCTARNEIGGGERAWSWSADGGVTWDDFTKDSTMPERSTMASLIRLDSNTLVLSKIDNPSGRSKLVLCYNEGLAEIGSANSNGRKQLDWSNQRVLCWRDAGYSDMCIAPDGNLVITYENGWFGATDSAATHSYQIGVARLNKKWITGTDFFDAKWLLNDFSVGTTAVSDSQATLEDSKLFAMKAKPVGEPTVVASDYAGSSGRALDFNGSSQYVLLYDAKSGIAGTSNPFTINEDEPFYLEVVVKTDASENTAGTIASMGTGSAEGWSLEFETTGKVTFHIHDGSTDYDVTSTDVVNDGDWHHIACGRLSDGTLFVSIDGAANDTDTGTTDQISNAVDVVLAARSNTATNFFDGQIDSVRIARIPDSIVVEPELLSTGFGSNPDWLPSTPAPAGRIDSYDGLQMWFPQDNKQLTFIDNDYVQKQPTTFDTSRRYQFSAMFDASGNGLRAQAQSNYYYGYWMYDSDYGWSRRYDDGSGDLTVCDMTVEGGSSAAVRTLDFIQNTLDFTIVFWIKPDADHNAASYILDTNKASSANVGFSLRYLTATQNIQMFITRPTSTTRISETSASSSVPKGEWTMCVVRGKGEGNKIDFFFGQLDDANLTKYADVGTADAGSDGTTAASFAMQLGARAQGFNSRFVGNLGEIAVFDEQVSDADLEEHFDYVKSIAP